MTCPLYASSTQPSGDVAAPPRILLRNRGRRRNVTLCGAWSMDPAGTSLGAWGARIDKRLSILLLRQEPLVQGAVPEQG
jgi:hypothetical protein